MGGAPCYRAGTVGARIAADRRGQAQVAKQDKSAQRGEGNRAVDDPLDVEHPVAQHRDRDAGGDSSEGDSERHVTGWLRQ